MIQIDSVFKQYQRRGQTVTALHATTLSVEQGEFIAIVGPSGSGKTTLLSMLGGMLAPTSGTVQILGENLYQLGVAARSRFRNEKIGFVFQNFNLVPWLTALENVQLPLTIGRAEASVQRNRALELLERFGLSDRADHKPSELSAGQQQRVALARTLIATPRLILADEPTGNLDPESRAMVMESLRDCQRQFDQTIILVTHDNSIADTAERKLRITAGVLTDERPRLNVASA
ncbi:ABC transporter ATP-binding protein [Rubinisphaera margarita]|uniref:ABC transporter ATP-binding protein n=1 Tax=Rubinisphaera margarita TaxID=2909586 RepID=UPI001EE82D80|nr:ABC transporter ATP-binding protein [Rubinisphaera margarita]MCG6158232.1 ABC transporter ATP-binding protein [Rubinisphaera margarita]